MHANETAAQSRASANSHTRTQVGATAPRELSPHNSYEGEAEEEAEVGGSKGPVKLATRRAP